MSKKIAFSVELGPDDFVSFTETDALTLYHELVSPIGAPKKRKLSEADLDVLAETILYQPQRDLEWIQDMIESTAIGKLDQLRLIMTRRDLQRILVSLEPENALHVTKLNTNKLKGCTFGLFPGIKWANFKIAKQR